ncbi:hypothetical protein M670_03663 [Schinkia azotoformans MEV2011]|uniref:Glycerophosphoryl diester phosphodiesterase membrane domain-containing protein n=1 Tax=Schinkia azotoformans MEV2011 TaxID=1348973 RepID=A0A072NIK5_SCHAZ|nr:hypothetical protein [Schinkia azotoformans]KEF37072.1 hypothetical protein M670_03663 [Schinkia azotoformans MEV2011]MEC1697695.1 hypothetical protein [Schinkia azotoformans]MEC1718674.1 hypothetical protein [Schinkia azotoformans]MEC1727447.1 hypothetical protein [Schinkia azotoformans]MEC1739343.1 hypothetical protein [Schinkia azotoformans]
MNDSFTTPKGFGEILDVTFRLSKQYFTKLFLILLLLIGPIYLLQAIILLVAGESLIRGGGEGGKWFEQVLSSFDESDYVYSSSIKAESASIILDLVSIFLYFVATAAILYAVNHIRNNEDFTVGSVIKQGFSRFFPIMGSSLLYIIIIIGLSALPIFILGLLGVTGAAMDPIFGIVLAILGFIVFGVAVGYLVTRLSFYFCVAVLEKSAPGFSRSWKLTRKRVWALMGLYIAFYFIIGVITFAVEFSFAAFLGNSVLVMTIVNVVFLFTTMLLTVGYAVMYFDLKIRNDADDLKEMIEDYNRVH